MKLIILIGLLMFISPSTFSQQSNEDELTCFTPAELEAMEDEAAQITEDAVVEAVNEAVAPYRITVQNMNAEIEIKNRSIMFWKITTGVSAGMAVVFAVLFVVSHLIPPVP